MIRSYTAVAAAAATAARGRIGKLRSVIGAFSYFNRDPHNIRNKVECGGGALLRHRLLLYPRVAHGFRRGADARCGADGARSEDGDRSR